MQMQGGRWAPPSILPIFCFYVFHYLYVVLFRGLGFAPVWVFGFGVVRIDFPFFPFRFFLSLGEMIRLNRRTHIPPRRVCCGWFFLFVFHPPIAAWFCCLFLCVSPSLESVTFEGSKLMPTGQVCRVHFDATFSRVEPQHGSCWALLTGQFLVCS